MVVFRFTLFCLYEIQMSMQAVRLSLSFILSTLTIQIFLVFNCWNRVQNVDADDMVFPFHFQQMSQSS